MYSEVERAALEYAERITITEQRVDDAIHTRLKEHFDEAQIVELTAGAYHFYSNRLQDFSFQNLFNQGRDTVDYGLLDDPNPLLGGASILDAALIGPEVRLGPPERADRVEVGQARGRQGRGGARGEGGGCGPGGGPQGSLQRGAPSPVDVGGTDL